MRSNTRGRGPHRNTGSLWACSPPSEKPWEDQRSDFEFAGEEKTTEGVAEEQTNTVQKPTRVCIRLLGGGGVRKEAAVHGGRFAESGG